MVAVLVVAVTSVAAMASLCVSTGRLSPKRIVMSSIEWVINKLASFTDRGFIENQAQCKAARAEYEELKNAAQQSVQADGDYCTCENIVAWKIVGEQDVCVVCNRPRR